MFFIGCFTSELEVALYQGGKDNDDRRTREWMEKEMRNVHVTNLSIA